MRLQTYLIEKFRSWRPSAPEVVTRNKGDITLNWKQEEWDFLHDDLLYRVEKNNKLPKWIVVYSGGKTKKLIDYLAPSHPHRFRLKVILKAAAAQTLAERALAHYGDEHTVHKTFDEHRGDVDDNINLSSDRQRAGINDGDYNRVTDIIGDGTKSNDDMKSDKTETGDDEEVIYKTGEHADTRCTKGNATWVESAYSEETWTSTDSEGTSAVCFCMAVKCGYLKQVQAMLEERPALLGIVNTRDGCTPLATAARTGDINMSKFLLAQGAEVEQPASAGQTPLHVAVLAGCLPMVELLLEKGADIQARDWNCLRAEHYAVDSGSLEMLKLILNIGDVNVKDNNGWTPLFRAICQGAKTDIVEELVVRGSDLNAVDNAGLPLSSAAQLLKNRHGRRRTSILKLVDCHYPQEKGLANFTRLTKKIYNVHTLLKLT